jgi:hypothetical protein
MGYFSFKWIGNALLANFILMLVTSIGITILVFKNQRFNKNEQKNTQPIYLISN